MKILVSIHSPFLMWNIPDAHVQRLRAEFRQHTFLHAGDDAAAVDAIGDADIAFSSQVGPAQLAAAQKATRPTKPEELAWSQLQQQWRDDPRGLGLDRAAVQEARAARRAAAPAALNHWNLAAAAEKIDKAVFTRADLVEIVAAQLPVDGEQSPRAAVEAAMAELELTRRRI